MLDALVASVDNPSSRMHPRSAICLVVACGILGITRSSAGAGGIQSLSGSGSPASGQTPFGPFPPSYGLDDALRGDGPPGVYDSSTVRDEDYWVHNCERLTIARACDAGS